MRISERRSGMRRTIGAVLYGFHVMTHPFDGFWELKRDKKRAFPAAVVITALTVLSAVLKIQASGFLFKSFAAEDYNLPLELLTVLGPLALWVCVNWSITTLFDGKADMKMIFISTAFAMLPLALFFLPGAALSHFLTQEEGVFIIVIDIAAGLWCAFLLLTGSSTVQEYSMLKTVVSAIATVLGIIAVLFLLSVFISAISQLIEFFTTIIMELLYW